MNQNNQESIRKIVAELVWLASVNQPDHMAAIESSRSLMGTVRVRLDSARPLDHNTFYYLVLANGNPESARNMRGAFVQQLIHLSPGSRQEVSAMIGRLMDASSIRPRQSDDSVSDLTCQNDGITADRQPHGLQAARMENAAGRWNLAAMANHGSLSNEGTQGSASIIGLDLDGVYSEGTHPIVSSFRRGEFQMLSDQYDVDAIVEALASSETALRFLLTPQGAARGASEETYSDAVDLDNMDNFTPPGNADGAQPSS